jgi:uncharacterized RDD family membrane protein YckC
MKKITDLTEKRFRTNYIKDSNGNRKKETKEYIAKRPVKTVLAGPRFGHFIIDLICFQIVTYIISYLFELVINLTNSVVSVSLTLALISSIVYLLIYPALYFLCEYKWQRTPGKFLTKTIVIDEYGNKPELRQLALRSLIRLVPFEPFSCLGDNSNGWHDRWATTFVVKEAELEEIKRLQQEQSK